MKLSQVECDLWLDPDFSLGEVVVSRFHMICHPIKLIGCPVNSVGTGPNWVKLSVTRLVVMDAYCCRIMEYTIFYVLCVLGGGRNRLLATREITYLALYTSLP